MVKKCNYSILCYLAFGCSGTGTLAALSPGLFCKKSTLSDTQVNLLYITSVLSMIAMAPLALFTITAITNEDCNSMTGLYCLVIEALTIPAYVILYGTICLS